MMNEYNVIFLLRCLSETLIKEIQEKTIFLILLKKFCQLKKYMRCECLKIKMVKEELDVPEYS